jgi:hypothetical protein
MLARPLPFVAIFLALAGCAGAQKPAESPASADSTSSAPPPELTSGTADRSIQPEKGGSDSASAAAPAPAEGASAPTPQTSSELEAAVVSGKALPPPPPVSPSGKTAKAHKSKKPGKKGKTTKTAKAP